MMRARMICLLGVVAVLLAGLTSTGLAVPYASGIQLAGASSSFILNEDSANVSVVYDGGSTVVDLGTLAKGTHTFDATLGATWEIVAKKNGPPGWTQISDDNATQSKYYSPRGVAVNRNSASSNFGRIYVSEGLAGTVAAGGRTTTDGIYALGADQSDILGQGDTAADGGLVDLNASSNSPFRVSVAPDDSVYITDWSDANAGLWRAPADLSGTFPNVLANDNQDTSGLADNHGSIPSVWVEGTGESTTVYTLDEDFDAGGTTGSVLRYDVGTATNYQGQPVQQTQDATNVILNLRADVVRDEDGSWWIAQYRWTESTGAPSLTHWEDNNETVTGPIYNSAADPNLPLLAINYGSLDIQNEQDLLALGTRNGQGVYIVDIGDPNNPDLADTIPQTGFVQDVAFDAAGNLYLVNNTSETLGIWSPGGSTVATTASDGTFDVLFSDVVKGDLNGDGVVNNLDVPLFVDVLLNGPFNGAADMNDDNWVNGLDVAGFVAAAQGGGVAAVPEPSAVVLLLLGLTALVLRRRR